MGEPSHKVHKQLTQTCINFERRRSIDRVDDVTATVSVPDMPVDTLDSVPVTPVRPVTSNTKEYMWTKFRSELRGGSDRRRIVYCTTCVMFPDIVKLNCGLRVPAICTEAGAIFRQATVDDHDKSQCHVVV